MKINIKGTNIKLTTSIYQNIEDKIGGLKRFVKRIDPELIEARVEVGKITRKQRQGEIFRAEVNLNLNGQFLRAEETGESLIETIDLVKDKLAGEIKSLKDKRMTAYKRGARSIKKMYQINPLARFRKDKDR
ncbi:ribosome hibernation-promoting factor, HPF/YfiA family [Patescibacteria group bacterium]